MGSEIVGKLNQSNGESLFDAAVSMSFSNVYKYFQKHKTCEKTSLELLVYASEFDYKDTNILAADVCKNIIGIAISLDTDSISRAPTYIDAYKEAHFKYAQLQVIALKDIYKTESYIHILSYIKSICFSLELANRSDTYILVPTSVYDHYLFKDVGLAGYHDNLFEDISLSNIYQHQGLIDAGLTRDDMKSIILSVFSRDLKSIGATAEDIEVLKEKV